MLRRGGGSFLTAARACPADILRLISTQREGEPGPSFEVLQQHDAGGGGFRARVTPTGRGGGAQL